MFGRDTMRRTLQLGACAVAVLLLAPPAAAKPPTPQSCSGAYRSALKLEQSGRLHEAQKELIVCGRASCGPFLHNQCTIRYTRIDAEMPSVVPSVTDESGAPMTDVQVHMDGQLLTSRIDGRSLPIAPGMHEFKFETEKGVIATQKVVILQGQRNRPIAVSLGSGGGERAEKETRARVVKASSVNLEPRAEKQKADSEEAIPAEAVSDTGTVGPKRSNLTAYLLLGTGAAGIVSYAVFTYWGRRDNNDLNSMCAPECDPANVDHVRNMYLTANISLGIGIPALLAGGYLWWRNGNLPPSKYATAPSKNKLAVDVQPTRSGAFATVTGPF